MSNLFVIFLVTFLGNQNSQFDFYSKTFEIEKKVEVNKNTIPTDPSLIGVCTVSQNGCIELNSPILLKEWYKFEITNLNLQSEEEAIKFCGMNSSNLFLLEIDFEHQKGYVHLYQNRLGAPTSFESWNNYFNSQCN